MVSLTKIYTRGGDDGDTSLGDGRRVRKNALRVETFGTVDEANAIIGLVRVYQNPEIDEVLARVQNDLFDLGADLCVPGTDHEGKLRMIDGQVNWLEQEIDRYNEVLAPLNSFVLPGGVPAAAYLHQARTTTRRAERLIVALSDQEPVNPAAVRYLNRLSDLLFVLSRYVNDKGARDVLWIPGASRDAVA